jgi:hypothetical protein
MDEWYGIGVVLGLGVALGVLVAAIVGASRLGVVAAAAVGAAGAVALALVVDPASSDVAEWVAGAAGGCVGGFGAAPIVRGTLRRGGTRGGTALLVGGAAVVLGALALVPAVGFLEAVGLPVLAARLRRRAPERYEGLRTLARD